MALFYCARLGGKSVLSTVGRVPTVLGSSQYAQMAAGIPKISIKKYEPPQEEHFDVRNARLNRPMSPHLTIYQPQLTSMLSITHRIAGMMLSGYVGILGIGALVLPGDVSHYVTMLEGLHLSAASLFMIKAVLAAPFGYHLANGLRHLYWDTARGLTIKEVYTTGYMMLGATTLITMILASL
ncbi:succinate dehydrogenase/Fumarate reductase transmembrane subunit domain-containing protein [Phthorimaea operculella]|nr:succinate dehydrogenase/Fumarate reductase transmembrane subunit domain-containing protein [Phthorimaea operculella]